jgi:hypothetical protein
VAAVEFLMLRLLVVVERARENLALGYPSMNAKQIVIVSSTNMTDHVANRKDS